MSGRVVFSMILETEGVKVKCLGGSGGMLHWEMLEFLDLGNAISSIWGVVLRE